MFRYKLLFLNSVYDKGISTMIKVINSETATYVCASKTANLFQKFKFH